MKTLQDQLPVAARAVAELLQQHGGRTLAVGGWVRDALLDFNTDPAPAVGQDMDLEVYGIEAEQLQAILGSRYELDLVGRSFGVLKLHGLHIDVGIPRLETKQGQGHRGFAIDADPHLPPERAALRRDFTINAIAYDPLRDELLDPCDGQADLAARRLRHCSTQFSEDPLRVLRGMQFVARFGLEVAPETLALCSDIEPEGLAPERIFEEWSKLLCLGVQPSLGLAFLREVSWLSYYPELAALVGCPQDPDWHPEGDVWVHTGHCLDHFAAHRLGDAREDLIVGLAVLCHDLGKPSTTILDDGRYRSRGHSQAGEAPTLSFLGRMTNEKALIDDVRALVRTHLRPWDLYRDQSGDAAVRRLANEVGRIDRLLRVARSDSGGRPPLPAELCEAADWLAVRARALAVEDARPVALVMGRHLLAMGVAAGPRVGEILSLCYEAQLDGSFNDLEGGLSFAAQLLRSS